MKRRLLAKIKNDEWRGPIFNSIANRVGKRMMIEKGLITTLEITMAVKQHHEAQKESKSIFFFNFISFFLDLVFMINIRDLKLL